MSSYNSQGYRGDRRGHGGGGWRDDRYGGVEDCWEDNRPGHGGHGRGNRGSRRGNGGKPWREERRREAGYEPRSGEYAEYGRGRGGGGRGRGGGHPPGLKGKAIGLYYAKKSKEKQKKERTVAHLPTERLDYLERELGKVLKSQEVETGKSDHLSRLRHNIQGNAQMDDFYDFGAKKVHKSPDIGDKKSGDYLLRELDMDAYQNGESISSQTHIGPKSGSGGTPVADPTPDLDKTDSVAKIPSKMSKFRNSLPAAKKREEIIDLVLKNQVIVVSGETGCGKTTQIPQFILDNHLSGSTSSPCRIVVTQPRRISAISVAERISEERGESVGRSVGYQIRLESKLPRRHNSILLCTTGILLQWLQSSPTLESITHLVLDEIHERDIHSDFLMTICKNILISRPDLRLILMSATLESDKFSKYFNGCPKIFIPGFTYPVQDIFLEDVLELTKYRKPVQNSSRGLGRRQREREYEYREEMGPFLRHLESTKNYSRSTIDYLWDPDSEELDMELTASLVHYIHRFEDDGAILVFVPGWEQISKLNKLLESPGPYCLTGSFSIFPLHSLLPTSSQRSIFERPPRGNRKIVIATNIAETSITIEDIVYVIDCGKIKIKNFDTELNISTLQPEWISLANMKQRRGRAGRVQPGKCYHLFTKGREGLLQSYLPPELCRTSLEEVILQIKLLELGSCSKFLNKVLDPPSPQAIQLSLRLLQTINAIKVHGESEELTPLGFHLAQLPLDPQTGKMILMAAIFSCLDPVLSVAASLSFRDAFVVPLGKEKEVDSTKKDFGGTTRSDHLMLANVITEYYNAKNKNYFCYDNFISESTIKMLVSMKGQLAHHLYAHKFLKSSDYMDSESNVNSNNEPLVRAIICAGLYPNVAKIKRVKKNPNMNTLLMSKTEKRILFHPKSLLCNEMKFPYHWVVYHLKQKSSQTYLHDATVVSPLSLLFFGQEVRIGEEILATGERLETVSADSFIMFNCQQRTSALVRKAREALDTVIVEKVSRPCPTSWTSRQGQILDLVISLLDTELDGLQFEEDDE